MFERKYAAQEREEGGWIVSKIMVQDDMPAKWELVFGPPSRPLLDEPAAKKMAERLNRRPLV
jgi:hypothetical protein